MPRAGHPGGAAHQGSLAAAEPCLALPMGYLSSRCQPYGEGKSIAYKNGASDNSQRTTVSLAWAVKSPNCLRQ
jgi:hypothetical protein